MIEWILRAIFLLFGFVFLRLGLINRKKGRYGPVWYKGLAQEIFGFVLLMLVFPAIFIDIKTAVKVLWEKYPTFFIVGIVLVIIGIGICTRIIIRHKNSPAFKKNYHTPAKYNTNPKKQPYLKYQHKLIQQIRESFSEEDVKMLCVRVNVDYDDLPASGKTNKVRELVLHLTRENRISPLIKILKEERPHIDWDHIL